MTVRLLVAGSRQWRDGTSIRAALRAILDRYGYDQSHLILIANTEAGTKAIAKRAWAELPGVDPDVTVFTMKTPWGDDVLNQVNLVKAALAETRAQAVLVFAPKQSTEAKRAVQLARERNIPAWRWSASLGRLVEAGVDVHKGRYKGVARDDMYDDGRA